MAFISAELKSKELERFLDSVERNYKGALKGTDVAFFKAIAIPALAQVTRNFEKESGPKGKWDVWSDTYEAHLKRIGRSGNKILNFNGDLKKGLKIVNSRQQTKRRILVFNNAQTKDGFSYARHHDEGGSAGKNKPRPFMWINKGTLGIIAKIGLKILLEGKKRGKRS